MSLEGLAQCPPIVARLVHWISATEYIELMRAIPAWWRKRKRLPNVFPLLDAEVKRALVRRFEPAIANNIQEYMALDKLWIIFEATEYNAFQFFYTDDEKDSNMPYVNRKLQEHTMARWIFWDNKTSMFNAYEHTTNYAFERFGHDFAHLKKWKSVGNQDKITKGGPCILYNGKRALYAQGCR